MSNLHVVKGGGGHLLNFVPLEILLITSMKKNYLKKNN